MSPKTRRPFLWIAAPLAVLALAPLAATVIDEGGAAPACELGAIGEPAPLRPVHFEGDVWLVDFWASWCEPCARAFPFLNELERDLGDRGLRILGVNLDEVESEARDFLTRFQPGFELAYDPDGSCPRAFGVAAMPSTYLIDREGVVRYVFKGFREGEAERLRAAIETLLPPPAPVQHARGVVQP